jgi:hypothetical protein
MSEFAIFGEPKTLTELYPQWPVRDQRDTDAVIEVIRSGQWGGIPQRVIFDVINGFIISIVLQ